jgi:hypothetical protein
MRRFLDWLDRQNDAVFLFVLYVARWPVVLPVMLVQHLLAKAGLGGDVPELPLPRNPAAGLAALLVWAPIIETAIECTAPYSIMRALKKIRTNRPWNFVVISGAVMGIGHMHFGPFSLLAGFITGMFLGYCYAHFAARSQAVGFACASLYHAAINIVGWIAVYVLGIEL